MVLLEQYFKNKFDLSAFGIERGESRSDYFCTPKGARILGWTGVGGIHYCTLKAIGEKVFAVDPMGVPGKHAFPVAESFEDLLRLLMACGHEAHIEQAHAWSREQYDAFVRDNPILTKANEQILYLKKEYELTPLADPFEYLKTIYDSFDYSTIPYKNDYYEYVPKDEMPQPKEWKVYFSVFNRKGGERAGEELPLNARFSWGAHEWYIPSAYICAKGLVLDIFAEADTEKVHAFLFKWMHTAEDEEHLTADQREQIDAENPLAFDYRARVSVNGNWMQEKQGTGNGWVQGFEMYESESMRDILTHYGMDLETCRTWRRISFPWSTKTKPRIQSLQLKLEQRPIGIQGEHFRISEAGQQIKFTHPITKVEHTLTVHEYEQDVLDLERQFSVGYEHPTHLTKMSYTLSPALSSMQFSISDSRQSDAPRKVQTEDPQEGFASALAIIGRADGPTAVIMGVPKSSQNLRAACSALTFEPQSDVEWKMTFREKTVEVILIDLSPAATD